MLCVDFMLVVQGCCVCLFKQDFGVCVGLFFDVVGKHHVGNRSLNMLLC